VSQSDQLSAAAAAVAVSASLPGNRDEHSHSVQLNQT